jgi:hypothetical protein
MPFASKLIRPICAALYMETMQLTHGLALQVSGKREEDMLWLEYAEVEEKTKGRFLRVR